jgi:hypothetical protein
MLDLRTAWQQFLAPAPPLKPGDQLLEQCVELLLLGRSQHRQETLLVRHMLAYGVVDHTLAGLGEQLASNIFARQTAQTAPTVKEK